MALYDSQWITLLKPFAKPGRAQDTGQYQIKIKLTFTRALAIAFMGAASGASIAAAVGGVVANPGVAAGKHFHPKGKLPSKFTIELRKCVSATLPLEDKRDFDEAKKGFIATVLQANHGRRRSRRLGHG